MAKLSSGYPMGSNCMRVYTCIYIIHMIWHHIFFEYKNCRLQCLVYKTLTSVGELEYQWMDLADFCKARTAVAWAEMEDCSRPQEPSKWHGCRKDVTWSEWHETRDRMSMHDVLCPQLLYTLAPMLRYTWVSLRGREQSRVEGERRCIQGLVSRQGIWLLGVRRAGQSR